MRKRQNNAVIVCYPLGENISFMHLLKTLDSSLLAFILSIAHLHINLAMIMELTNDVYFIIYIRQAYLKYAIFLL